MASVAHDEPDSCSLNCECQQHFSPDLHVEQESMYHGTQMDLYHQKTHKQVT